MHENSTETTADLRYVGRMGTTEHPKAKQEKCNGVVSGKMGPRKSKTVCLKTLHSRFNVAARCWLTCGTAVVGVGGGKGLRKLSNPQS